MTYGTSPTKRRRRRSKAEIEAIKDAIYNVLAEDHPQTVRQVFYRLSTIGVVEKTQAEYKTTVCRLLGEMRRERTIPYTWIADSTRWMRRPRTYSSMEEALTRTAETYRRGLWDDADLQVEVWLEKEALAGVLAPVTETWDVPLMVTRGYPSMSFTHSAAEAVAERWCSSRQRTTIYYFGDRDPSGTDIDRTIITGIGESLLTMFDWEIEVDPTRAFGTLVDFERLAVTEAQIVELDLPTRPTKSTDTRGKNFAGDSVEVDAIPSGTLREIAESAIEQHVDHRQLEVLKAVEESERDGIRALALAGGGDAV